MKRCIGVAAGDFKMAEVTLERDTTVPGLAWITFTRPEAKNALSNVGWRELSDALDAVDGDRSLGVVAIRGTGDAFSAGAGWDTLGRARAPGAAVLPLLRRDAPPACRVNP